MLKKSLVVRLAGGGVIWLSVSGYPTLRVPAVIGEEEVPALALNRSGSGLGNLGTIVVTATRLPEKLSDLPTNVNVVTKEEIARTDARNAGEAIALLPGVKVTKKGTIGAESGAALRGSSYQQVLVMIDGRSVNSTSLGGANLGEIPVENIERIEVVRGPASALYGANALGGVVNIITAQAKEGKPLTELYASYGDFNTQLYRANFGIKKGKFNTFLSVSKNLSNGWRENSNCDRDNFMVKLGYDAGKIGKLLIGGGYYQDDLGSPGAKYIGLEEYDGKKEKESLTPNARQHDGKKYLWFEYQNKFFGNSNLRLRLYGNNNEQSYQDPDTHPKQWIFTPVDDAYKNITNGVETQVDTLYGLTLGSDFHQDSFHSRDMIAQADKINEKFSNGAIFIQESLTFRELRGIFGLRWDNHSVYGGQVNPRLSLVYRPIDWLKLSTNIGRAYRAPTFNDLYWPDPWMPGNPDLKPEKSWAYDLGMEYQLRNIFLGKVNLFRSDYTDLIQWAPIDPTDPWSPWTPSNVSRAYNQGSEIELAHRVIPGLEQSLNYTYLWNQEKAVGEADWQLGMYKPLNRVNYRVSYTSDFGLGIVFSAVWTDKQWSGKDRTGCELPSYTLLNLGLSQKILGGEIFISGNNLLDKKYQTMYGYPLPGRTISGGLRMKLWD